MNPQGEPQHFVKSGSPGLPASYGRTKVVVLPIDPFHVHAYWEVTEKDRLLAMKRLDPMGAHRLSWVLRFHDVSSDRARVRDDHFDVFVDRAARNWYIELWSPGRRYWVELGTAFGARFSPVSRSREVELPRAEPAPAHPPRPEGEPAATPREGGARGAGIAALSPPEGFDVSGAPAPDPGAHYDGEAARVVRASATQFGSVEPRREGTNAESFSVRQVLAAERPQGTHPQSRSLADGASEGPVSAREAWSSSALGRKGKRA